MKTLIIYIYQKNTIEYYKKCKFIVKKSKNYFSVKELKQTIIRIAKNNKLLKTQWITSNKMFYKN